MIKLDKSYMDQLARKFASAQKRRDTSLSYGTEDGICSTVVHCWWPAFFYQIANESYLGAKDSARRLIEDAEYGLGGKAGSLLISRLVIKRGHY
jgi:hypothetical protein